MSEDDAALLADLNTERTALTRELLTDPEAGKEIINGSSFGASLTMTKAQRLEFWFLCFRHSKVSLVFYLFLAA